jgi:hypothetical protein
MSFLLQSPSVIQGIGPAYASRLLQTGISNIGQMFRAGPAAVHKCCPDAGAKQVGSWLCAASLLRVPGIDPEAAEHLVKADIRSVRQLGSISLRDLANKVEAVQGSAADPYELADMQDNARQFLDRGLFFGQVQYADGSPAVGATIDLGAVEAVADSAGWFAFDALEPRTYVVRVVVPNRNGISA